MENVSLVALLVSLGTAWWTVVFNRGQMNSGVWTNLNPIVQVERSLGQVPSAFRFHGITETNLSEAGVTAEELAYLVASFTSGHIYHMTHNPDAVTPFPENSYRYQMLSAPATQQAWPLIKRMLSGTNYTQRLDATLASILKKRNA